MQRHETLRVGFWRDADGEVRQQVADVCELNWFLHDWAHLDRMIAEVNWRELLDRNAPTPIVVDVPPLWRVNVSLFPDGRLSCIWTFHHALLDGRSIFPLLNELQRLLSGKRPTDQTESVE